MFTALPGIQEAHRLYYRLYPNETQWQVELEYQDSVHCRSEFFALRCVEQKAEDLLRFLYENAVPPESARALAEDTMPEAVAVL